MVKYTILLSLLLLTGCESYACKPTGEIFVQERHIPFGVGGVLTTYDKVEKMECTDGKVRFYDVQNSKGK